MEVEKKSKLSRHSIVEQLELVHTDTLQKKRYEHRTVLGLRMNLLYN